GRSSGDGAISSDAIQITTPGRYDGAVMMARTQITLEPEIQRKAKRKASEMGVSLAESIRQLVAKDLGAARPKADITALFNLGSSGGSDIAKNKDAMIGEAFWAEHKRSTSR